MLGLEYRTGVIILIYNCWPYNTSKRCVLNELAKSHKDEYIITHLLAEYNRVSFVKLMILLNKGGIENNIRNMLTGI